MTHHASSPSKRGKTQKRTRSDPNNNIIVPLVRWHHSSLAASKSAIGTLMAAAGTVMSHPIKRRMPNAKHQTPNVKCQNVCRKGQMFPQRGIMAHEKRCDFVPQCSESAVHQCMITAYRWVLSPYRQRQTSSNLREPASTLSRPLHSTPLQ